MRSSLYIKCTCKLPSNVIHEDAWSAYENPWFYLLGLR